MKTFHACAYDKRLTLYDARRTVSKTVEGCTRNPPRTKGQTYMSMELLNTAEDLQWARDVHGAPEWAQCVIVHGNMDYPEKIECYRVSMPRFDAEPDAVVLCFEDAPEEICPECARSYGPNYRGPCEH